jgi:cell division protein FtsW (lipid II flippase)
MLFSYLAGIEQLKAQPQLASPSSSSAQQPVDPNKAPSEFNHHIAGWALIGVSILVLASQFSPRMKVLSYVLPLLFVGVGLFLATWSDGEIWPRGNLNWLWLIHHDAEARQHKIYSVLLIAIGVIEYFRVRGSLPRSWRMWAFPALALIGAGMLLVHDHTGGSGARSPEAQAYLVNPMLDVDGTPRKPTTVESTPTSMDQADAMGMNHGAMDHGSMPMDHSQMDHSQMMMEATPNDSTHSQHHHEMSASMLMVEREHFWFMIVGIGIALFKFISDGKLLRSPVASYLWPTCMMVLGCALVVYRE